MAVPSAPPLPGAVFSVAEARALGLPPSRLRRKEFAAAGYGLRIVRGRERSLADQLRALAPEAGHTVASHVTAALLWGMWLPLHLDTAPLHLTRPLRYSQPRRRGVVGHNAALQQGDVVRSNGLLVTSPVFTWTDLACVLSCDDLVAVGDSLLRRQDAPPRGGSLPWPDPLCQPAEIQEVVERRTGIRGRATAVAAWGLLRAGVDSAPESHLRLLIHHAALPEPEVNQWITGPDGRVISRPDLQYRRLRIALEYEGEHHLLDPAQWHRDIERDDRLRQLGWVVLRFTKQHLRPENAPATAEKVRTALLARGWQPGWPT
ncbi:endonuclease domain-containing protein [Arthrobacter zhaoxinii]|uniref:endonuclease domain-containing protein n=1 Tax=Arthrobacter zhaoxinii TaxID=2964616 RepID=UPI002102308E|nr:endonuclease domain-containing protein [Arthrobacter zhaoxinii]MCQ2001618.1 endonuclease domain-containing protein [Arthrobacter zhaoxinii]